jgi:hypothetical protein
MREVYGNRLPNVRGDGTVAATDAARETRHRALPTTGEHRKGFAVTSVRNLIPSC